MAWYAYCLVEQSSYNSVRARKPYPVDNLKGIGGAQVFAFPSGDFAVMISEYLQSSGDQHPIAEHAAVVGECFRHCTALPFRFPTVFHSEDGIRQAVRANRRVLMQSVEELRGKAEMRLKIQVQEAGRSDVAVPVTAAAEYLEEMRRKAIRDRDRQTKARALSQQVQKALAPLQQEIACRSNGQCMTLDIAHLIEAAAVDKYHTRYETVARQLRDCQVVLTGPHPPYHFLPAVKTVHA